MSDKDTHLIWEIFTSNKEIPPVLTLTPQPRDSVESPEAYWHKKKKRKKMPKVGGTDGGTSPPVNQQHQQRDVGSHQSHSESNTQTSSTSGYEDPQPNAWIHGGINEDGNSPLRLDDDHILNDIKELPPVFVKGLGLLKGLQAIEDLPSGRHWSIGYERQKITKDLKNDLGSGLDRYYGQREQGGGLVAKVIPGSSIYMDADAKTRKILPSETGKRAFAIFFTHRREILDIWRDREEPDRDKIDPQDAALASGRKQPDPASPREREIARRANRTHSWQSDEEPFGRDYD